MNWESNLIQEGVALMFFGIIPFALGFGLGTLTAPRYVPSYQYPPYPSYPPYPYPYRGW